MGIYLEAGKKKDATVFEQTLSQGLAATKIAGDALNALQPVELHAVGMTSLIPQHAFTPSEHLPFDSNYVELATTEESQLINVPAVEIKSNISVIQASQLPVIEASAVVGPRVALQETKDQLVDVSPIANATVTCGIPVSKSSHPSVVQSISSSTSAVTPVLESQILVSDTTITSAKTVTFNSVITEINDLNPKSIDVQPGTQPCKTLVNNPLSSTPQFSLNNNTLQSCGIDTLPPLITIETSGKLIDISPLNDETQPLTNDTQFPSSFENQAFDEPSLLNEKNLVDRPPDTNTTQALQSIQPSTISSTLQAGREPPNFAPVSSEIVPVATVVTINTPRNVATNLKPVENKGQNTLPTLTNGIEVESFKMVKPAVNELNSEILEDSLNDDDFNDFDDDFVSSSSNAIFEDYLT